MIRKLLSAIYRLTDAVENLTEAVNALVVVMAKIRKDEKDDERRDREENNRVGK